MFRKLAVFALIAAFAAPLPSLAQGKKDSVVMGMTLEPPGIGRPEDLFVQAPQGRQIP